jgi:hypothetical protein
MTATIRLPKISLALGALLITNAVELSTLNVLAADPVVTSSATAATTPSTESSPAPSTTAAAPATLPSPPNSKDSPKEVYLKYYATLAAPNSTLSSIRPFQSKKTLEKIAKDKDSDQIFTLIKLMMPPSAVVLDEKITGKTATLNLTCTDAKEVNPFSGEPAKSVTKGEATLVQEDGIWKVEKESWSTKVGDAVDEPAKGDTVNEPAKSDEPAK